MTSELFREDAYLHHCDARIETVDGNAFVLDRSVFYPTGGGQPGDTGTLEFNDGAKIAVIDTRKDERGRLLHITAETADSALIGQQVKAQIDWPRRHRLMRMHTCLHLLCALIPAGVTGGSIRDGSGRLDFDLPESTLDKVHLTAELNRLVAENHPVRARWITDEELSAQPELVRTMSVSPPKGQGRVRVLEIDAVDLQPCGGTHVATTGEIGEVAVKKIEKKGKQNRRVNIVLGSA